MKRQLAETPALGSRTRLLVIVLIVLFGAPLPVMRHLYVDSVPAVTVEQAKRLLSESPDVLLLDVRSAQQFSRLHVDGAINQRAAGVMELPLEGSEAKTALVMCSSGISSAIAARRLSLENQDIQVFNVRGGIEAWIAHDDSAESLYVDPVAAPLFRESSTFEQIVAVASGFIIKPFYMLVALVLVILLWKQRSAGPRRAALGAAGFLCRRIVLRAQLPAVRRAIIPDGIPAQSRHGVEFRFQRVRRFRSA